MITDYKASPVYRTKNSKSFFVGRYLSQNIAAKNWIQVWKYKKFSGIAYKGMMCTSKCEYYILLFWDFDIYGILGKCIFKGLKLFICLRNNILFKAQNII